MFAETGQFALILAFLMCIAQAFLPLFGAFRRDRNFMAFADYSAIAIFLLITLSFFCLSFVFAVSDFSVLLVANNSQTAKPFIYKLTGVWANHEGSMLLWVLVLCTFTALLAVFGRQIDKPFKARVIAVQGLIAALFLAFILFTSNPFQRLIPAPSEGAGMNPILQDPGLAIHPPCLYMGYVGFSVTFSFAIAALIEGRMDRSVARWMKPWTLLAWSFLTLGITLGSFWAYYVLGWGGWWFWDPVENVSLMPWLAGTALLHSIQVVERREVFRSWSLLLAILTFSLSLVGTFVVRSGVLTSVHAFALDPARGVFILMILGAVTGGGLVLYAFRMKATASGDGFDVVSKETSLGLNNIFLVVSAATVFIGTFYPLLLDVLGRDKISVGAPYYRLTFVPVAAVMLVLLAAGPMVRWKRDSVSGVALRLRVPGLVAMLGLIGALWVSGGTLLLNVLGIALAVWIVAGTLWYLKSRLKPGSMGQVLMQIANLPRSTLGLALAHTGLGLSVAAIAIVTGWQKENLLVMRIGDTAEIAGYQVALTAVRESTVANYEAEQGRFVVSSGGKMIADAVAERRFYPVQQSQTTQTAIRTNFVSNLYIALGEQSGDGQWNVRLYYHPAAPWIWFGGALMALGGFVSLSERRVRQTVPAARSVEPVPA